MLIEIKAPFYSAGSPKQYDWTKDGFQQHGIGIKTILLKQNPELDIKLDGVVYKVNTTEAIDFIRKYKSVYRVKNSDVILGVFSKSLLKPLIT